MITELTPEQEAQIEIWKKRWFEIGSSTETADRPTTEKAITWAYEKIGKSAPQFVWVDSPAEAGVTIRCYQDMEKMSDEEVEALDWETFKKETKAKMKSLYTSSAFYGAQASYWVAYYKFCNEVVGVKYSDENLETLEFWVSLCKSCGWWWPYENVCVVSERPSVVKWDTRQEPFVLHSEEGPALQYRDGWSVYCHRGVRIPKQWVEDKDSIDPSLALTWENIEQRRVLAEILGWDRVLEQLDCKVVDKDDDPMIGELLRVDLPDAPGEQFLRVVCGTGRTFVIPVGRGHKTALEANAETYGLDVNVMRDYEVRT